MLTPHPHSPITYTAPHTEIYVVRALLAGERVHGDIVQNTGACGERSDALWYHTTHTDGLFTQNNMQNAVNIINETGANSICVLADYRAGPLKW